MDNMFSIYRWFYEVVSLPICVCDKNGDIKFKTPSTRESAFPQQFVNYCLINFRQQKPNQRHPLIIKLDLGIFIGVAQLDDENLLIIGPALLFSYPYEKLYAYFLHIIPSEQLLEFCDLIIHTPLFTYRKITMALSLAIALYNGRCIQPNEVTVYGSTIKKDTADIELGANMFKLRENSTYHASLRFEEKIYFAIESGNTQLLKQELLNPLDGVAGRMSNDPVMQERYTFVAFVSGAARAAIRGGLPQELSFSLADVYCQQMDSLDTIDDINILMYNMAIDYCQRVEDFVSFKRYSPPIQKCIEYINRNLHNKISRPKLSKECGLCTRSLSIKFKDETGLSIPDYIHNERIREAKHLLTHSEYSIADISNILQYSSQSYFTQIFRKFCGCTPGDYRLQRNT